MELREAVARAISPLQHRDNRALLLHSAEAAIKAIQDDGYVIVPRDALDKMQMKPKEKPISFGVFLR